MVNRMVPTTDYIDCLPGMEEGPAMENVAPYCVPADEPIPGSAELTLPGFPDANGDGVDDRLTAYLPILNAPIETFPPALPLDGGRELAATGSDLADLLFNSGTLTVAVAMIVVGFAFYWMDKNKWDRSE